MNHKTKIAASLALITLFSVSSCQNGSQRAEDTSVTTTPATTTSLKEEYAEIVEEIEVEDATVLENGTVKWLATWDLNPANGKAVPVALEMFQTKYGGNIEHIPVTWEERYDKLATLVASGESPDLFAAGDLDTFPRGAINSMFTPLDDYVDFDSPLWEGISNINEQFVYQDKHYVAAVSTDAGVVMIYNKRVIEENGLADPQELLEAGEWDWNSFRDMMMQFCSREESKFAIDGWWFETAFSLTSGVPFIGMEDGVIVSNLKDPMIAKAQDFMADMQRNDLPYPKAENNWQINPSNIALGKTLFYPCGIWALYEADLSAFGTMDEIAFVPMPKCPDADAYYLPTAVSAFALCSGAPNPEGAAAYINCERIAVDDERAQEIGKNQLFEDYGWTEEMYEMLQVTQDLTEANPMIDFYAAVSPDLNNLIHNPVKESFNNGVSWAQTRESIIYAVETEVERANQRLES